ncbi:DUF533 domain-containing protein [Rhodovulum sulfidophilum]|uniref:DUF533 domain-containing protein n=1 Tax=Rhodovulum sulfidophilum TaxID=35806 RepID=A0ABS1RXB5_RHOSU|nr:DUF533 domain-containing protein [Rhodovulum sulfidophilum]MBL3609609.1 DUF533 domain-containing protein [Rhodovulum sulfidophilum]MCE8456079.1 tellurite resistance TerB family protein [Rhodovulum sulfidophilum]
MSFVRTMATLAVGFAAARGLETFQKMGGGAGIADSVKSAATRVGIGSQIGPLLERMQVPGGAAALKANAKWLGAKGRETGDHALVGLGGLMAALGGAAWAGSVNARDILNAMGEVAPPDVSMEKNARLLIRSMVMAAKSDGEIDAAERAAIFDVLGDATEEERAFVEAEMTRPIDIEALAAETGTHQRTAVYAAGVVTTRLDSPAEIAHLDRLAEALHLGRAARQRIHKAMRLPQVLA